MNFDIDLTHLTDATSASNGAGVYDVLMRAAGRHVEKQYADNRLSGTEYASVYLGVMQATLAESVKFLLNEKQAAGQAELLAEQVASEAKNNEDGGVIDLSKQQTQEAIDLIIAQTAEQYEKIAALKADTNRKNLLNSKNVIHREKETELVIRQESELEQNGVAERALTAEKTIATTSGALDNTNKTNAEVALLDERTDQLALDGPSNRALTDAQIVKLTSETAKIEVDTTVSEAQKDLLLEQIIKTAKETLVLDARMQEILASTIRQDNESAQKIALMSAQTTGFKSDAKYKLLRQMGESYAVNTTTLGEITAPPSGSGGTAIDAVMNDILDDWNSSVNF